MKQTDNPITATLPLQDLSEYTQIFERIVLKSQDFFHHPESDRFDAVL
jgi:pterin-4a-carbinolamine dehydratase